MVVAMTPIEPAETGRLRSILLDRADTVDVRIQALLDRLNLSSSDPEYERVLDAIMGLCLVVDAARAYARDDIEAGDELARSMAFYTDRVLDEPE
jgi:hypothetical protein